MFHIVARERAWMFNPSGGQVIWDEATGGAAAGGRAAGDSTFAVVQLTDSKPTVSSAKNYLVYF